jgi:hypothetical protein
MKKIVCHLKSRIAFCLLLLSFFCIHPTWATISTLKTGNAKSNKRVQPSTLTDESKIKEKYKVNSPNKSVRMNFLMESDKISSTYSSVSASVFLPPVLSPLPILKAAAVATVDAPFSLTFTDDPGWRAAITEIRIGDNNTILPPSAYSISPGQISFNPSASKLLQMPGVIAIRVINSIYPIVLVPQVIGAGADNKLSVTIQPTAPASNGGVFAIEPVITIQDQYGNTTNSTLTLVAGIGNGAWTLGGNTTLKAIAGKVTFTNLTATSSLAIGDASILFSANGLASVTTNTFTIPPLYDVCSGALTIPWEGSVSADNTYANNKLFDGSPCSTSSYGRVKAIWFKVTPLISGPMIISTCDAAGMDIYLRVYTGICGSFNACAGYGDGNFICSSNQLSTAVIFSATANKTYYILCGLFSNSVKSGIVTINASPIILAPIITAASGATVDADFTIKFTDNANWRNAIINVIFGTTILKPNIDYLVTPGLIDLKPGGTLQSVLSKSGNLDLTVLATGYSNAVVSQTIMHGIPAHVTVTTQPTSPVTNGGVLVKQPAVTAMDQYGNVVGSGVMVNVTVTQGQDSLWSLGGTTSASTNSSGVATFSNLTATNKTGTAYSGTTLTFVMGTSKDTSASFTIPAHSASLPAVTTQAVTSIASTTAISGGNVTLDGYAAINQRGVVWNTQSAPVVSLGSKTLDGTGTGTFVSSISPLAGNTQYYYRSYATNKIGTSYGAENNFITLPASPVVMTAANLTSGSFIIRWNQLAQGNALSVTYEIQVSTNSTDFSSPIAAISDISKTDDPQQYILNSGLNNGTTYYFRIRSVTSAGYSNWSSVSAAVDLPAITLTISDNQQQIVAGTIARNSTNNILNQVQLVVANGTATLGGVAFTTPGINNNCNYTNADLTNLKLWYSTTNNFTTKTQVGTTVSSNKKTQLSPETILFPSLALILPANTYYFWITGDILNNASAGNTITINASVYTAIIGAVTNGCHNSGMQTIVKGIPTSLYLKNNLGSPLSVTDSSHWTTVSDGSSGMFYGKMGDNDLIWNIQNVNAVQSANWILGNNSKVIIGDGASIITLTINVGDTLVTGDAGLDILDLATLSIFTTSIPGLGSLSAGSTVNFSANSDQIIAAAAGSGYYNLTIDGSGCKTLVKDIAVNGMLAVNAGMLSIASNCLTIATKDGQVSGSGFIKSSPVSKLVISSTHPTVGTLNFDQSKDSVTNAIRNITVSGSGGITTLGNSLHITSGGMLNVTAGTLDLAGKHLILDGNTASGIAIVGQMTGSIIGATNVTVNLPIDNWGYMGKWPGSATTSSTGTWRNLTLPLSGGASTVYLNTLQSTIHITGPLGVNLDQIGGVNTLGYSCYKYVAGLDSPWIAIMNPAEEPMLTNTVAGIGANQCFWMYIRGPRNAINSLTDAPVATVLTATGALQTGDINCTYNKLTRGQFVLVGNPYVSPIDFNSSNLVIKGARKQLWLWDPTVSGINKTGKYNILDGLTTTSTEAINGSKICNILQPGQAFFLMADGTNNGTVQVLFKESCKPDHPSFISTLGLAGLGTQYEYLKIGLDYMNTDGTALSADALMALYNNNFSIDPGEEDVIKFPDPNGGISFKRNGTLLGIEGRPLIGNSDTLFINLAGMQSDGTYRLRMAGENFQSPNVTAYLEDKYLKNRQPVSLADGDTTSIQFAVKNNITASYAADRFMITFSVPGIPLAISLLSLSAAQQANSIVISWSASGESGVSAYELQRSVDGIVFNGIDNVTASNTTSGTNYYKWVDDNPAKGVNYYRLKILQINDNPTYSQVIKVSDNNNSKPGMLLYPNPVTNGEIIMQLNNLPSAIYSVILYNEAGLRVMQQTINHAGGSAVVTLRLSAGTAAGLYHLTLKGVPGKQYQKSIIIQ